MKWIKARVRAWREKRYHRDVRYIELSFIEQGSNDPMTDQEICFRASITLFRFWCILDRLLADGVLVGESIMISWRGRSVCHYRLGPQSAWAVV
jgi:hypothetical protein